MSAKMAANGIRTHARTNQNIKALQYQKSYWNSILSADSN